MKFKLAVKPFCGYSISYEIALENKVTRKILQFRWGLRIIFSYFSHYTKLGLTYKKSYAIFSIRISAECNLLKTILKIALHFFLKYRFNIYNIHKRLLLSNDIILDGIMDYKFMF